MEPRQEYTLRFRDGGTLPLGRNTIVMGVINVTPDSFSDGGRHLEPRQAIRAVQCMVDAGAQIIDIGGESTRPGAEGVDVETECDRVLGLVETIRGQFDVRISIDTMKAEVARRALERGADLVNDVSGLRDPEMLPLLCETRAPAVLMHMRGTPRTMQCDTRYDALMQRLDGYLRDRVETAAALGLGDDKIVVDPGIGFGKSIDGNLAILRQLGELKSLGRAILIGASRKAFIGAVLDRPVERRVEGSLAVAAIAAAHGAHIIRCHDVEATTQVVRMVDAIRHGTERQDTPRGE